MDFGLSDAEQLLHERFLRLAREELELGAAGRDAAASFSRALFARCGEAGLLGLPIPKEYGGGDEPPLSCALAFEALGEGCSDSGLLLSVGAHVLACSVPIWKHGDAVQRRRYLPGLARGELIGAGAMTEPDAGSDTAGIRTRAVEVTGGWALSGSKIFVTNASVADVFLVFAVTDPERAHGSLSAFVIDAGTPGLRVGAPFLTLGHRTAPLAELQLDAVQVGPEALLGTRGGGALIFAQGMEWERIGLFAGHVGAQQRLLNEAVARARGRRQFGRPIGRFQGVSHRIADMKVRLEAARLLVRSAAWRLDRSRDVGLHAAIAKLFASESLVKTAGDAVQIHGALGYLAGDQERALRDAVGTTLYSGTSEIQRTIIARWLGLW